MTQADALRFVLRWEAGWYAGDRPGDPNPTMRGITLRTLQGQGSAGDIDQDGDVDVDDLHHLTEAQAKAIYVGAYWVPSGCDRIARLAPDLAVVVFDAAVQHGSGRAVKLLQRTVSSTSQDGLYGRVTEAAIVTALGRMDDRGLCARYLGLRVQFYRDLMQAQPDKAAFEKGWRNRMNDLATCLGLPPVWP